MKTFSPEKTVPKADASGARGIGSVSWLKPQDQRDKDYENADRADYGGGVHLDSITWSTSDDRRLHSWGEHLEKKGKCNKACDLSLLKCIVLGVLVVAVVVGTIIGVTFYATKNYSDSKNYRGIITSDIAEPNECHDNKPALGQQIVINCSIDRKTWLDDILPVRIEAVHNNPALNVSVRCKPSGRNVTCLLPGVANCSSRGRFDINFYNSTDTKARAVFTKSVVLQVPTSYPVAQIKQEYLNNTNTSVFHLSCQYDRDCERYHIRFYGNGYILTDQLQCNSSYSDTNGQSISCSAYVSKEIVLQYGNWTNLYCQVMNGDLVHRNKTFDLPG